MTVPRLVVIVGGGVASLRVAERLAERGYDGRIEIVAAEPHAPYRRHALSERFARPGDAAALGLRARLGSRVTWHRGRTAIGLDRADRSIVLDDGAPGPYERLVIATGSHARVLPGTPASERIVVLRTLADALRLHALARRSGRLLVVGGGLVGSEAAAMLRRHGLRVTVVDPAPTLLAETLGPRMGAAVTALHRRRGVEVHTGAGIAGWELGARGVTAHLTDGRVLHADGALMAVGGRPAVDWLAGSGLDIADGVRCEATTHVAGASDLVACGDCARWPNLRFGGAPRRAEQWPTAVAMARHAADAVIDGPGATPPFAPVPWGWTDQFGHRLTIVGRPLDGALEAVGKPERMRGALVGRTPDGALTGAIVANDPAFAAATSGRLAQGSVPTDLPPSGRRAGGRRRFARRTRAAC